MEYSSVINQIFNVRVECDGYVPINNIVDLYERDRQKRLMKSYFHRRFKEKDFKKELKKFNKTPDHGDCVTSKDYLLFKQLYEYEIRFLRWNTLQECKGVTVSMKIGKFC